MFSSRTILEHVIRGVVGFGSVVVIVLISRHFGPVQLLISLALVGIALFAWRGCPMCWAVGLLDTILEPRSKAAAPERNARARRGRE